MISYFDEIIYSLIMRLSLVLVVTSSILFAPVAGASTKAVKPAPVDYSDVTGPKLTALKLIQPL